MSTFRNPVGPQPSTVYWRRRLVVGIGLLAVIIIILLIVFSPKGGTPTSTQTTPPAGTAQTPGATADPAADAPACDNEDLTVTAAADKASYSAEEIPSLSFTITNEGSEDCMVTAGSDVQVYQISSGDEVYWDSTKCQTDPVPAVALIKAGENLAGGPITWNRTRSNVCDGSAKAVPAGDVTYVFTVSVNGVTSDDVRIRLL
jgi:hypothetical protein